jgi:DNA-binding LytR/AlgR family response regulator
MSKVRCVILDDELPGLDYLRLLCGMIPVAEVLKCYDSPEQFISESPSLDFDVCLLDIHMPGLSGLDVARSLKDRYVIFVSAHPEFAVDAFELDAVDFIRKPVTKDRLEKALLKAQQLTGEKNERRVFTWNTSFGRTIIRTDEIAWASTSEVDKRDKLLHLSDGRSLLLKNITIDKLLSFLPAGQFMQVNRSEIVSRMAVRAHTSNEITLRHSSVLPLGENYRKAFQDWIR